MFKNLGIIAKKVKVCGRQEEESPWLQQQLTITEDRVFTGIFQKKGKGIWGMQEEDKEGWRLCDGRKDGWSFQIRCPPWAQLLSKLGEQEICSFALINVLG